MTKENANDNQSQKREVVLSNWEVSQDLVNFFYNNSKEEINENCEKLRFWQKVLLETELMDDAEHRKEFNRIIMLLEDLAVISNKFSKQQIVDNLEFLAFGRSITYRSLNSGKEVGRA